MEWRKALFLIFFVADGSLSKTPKTRPPLTIRKRRQGEAMLEYKELAVFLFLNSCSKGPIFISEKENVPEIQRTHPTAVVFHI